MTGIRKIKEMKNEGKNPNNPNLCGCYFKKTKTKILNKKSDIWKT